MQQTRGYAELVREAQALADDIQSLSQYIDTQRTAFRKMLKKYRKWTGSGDLQTRMNREIFNQSTSFLSVDIESLMGHWSSAEVKLGALSGRKGLQNASAVTRESSPMPGKSSAASLNEVFNGRFPLAVDAALLSLPLGHAAGRAVYWIHPDNIIAAKVLLLRYMRQQDPGTPTSNEPASRVHCALHDNAQRFVNEQGATTVGQIEEAQGSVASQIALNIIRNGESEAVVVASDLTPVHSTKASRHCQIIRIKQADLTKCPTPSGDRTSTNDRKQPMQAQKSSNQKAVTLVSDFLTQHRDVKPLAEIHSSRTRLIGATNSTEVGTWALLDQEITMTTVSLENRRRNSNDAAADNFTEGPSGKAFPHAVLSIRWEFSRTPEVVRAFDSTHLAERVRGFSLETEAISSICRDINMPKPFWEPILEKDIQKVPPTQVRAPARKNRSGQTTPEGSTPLPISGPSSTEGPSEGPSTSIFSTTQGQSSATSVLDSVPTSPLAGPQERTKLDFKLAGPPKKGKSANAATSIYQPPVQRYWNEFDDGSDADGEDEYAIYVTPDEPMSFPGAETVSKAFSTMYQSLRNGKRRVTSWLPFISTNTDSDEREPLLGGRSRTRSGDDSSESDSSQTAAKRRTRHPSKVFGSTRRAASSSTLRQRKARKSHESAIFRTYLAAFLVADGLLVLSALLQSTGRHKARFEVDAGVIVGVVAALFCGIGGVVLMFTRKEPLPLLHRLAVYLAFAIICAGSGYMLTIVGTTT